MRENLRDRDIFLPRRAEFRPIAGDRGLIIEKPVRNRARHQETKDRLAARIDADERIRRPRCFLCFVRVAAADIDHRLAANDDGEGGAELQPLFEILRERLACG